MLSGEPFGIESGKVLLSGNTAPRCTSSNRPRNTTEGGCGATAGAANATAQENNSATAKPARGAAEIFRFIPGFSTPRGAENPHLRGAAAPV
jgi:hypothetical protein